MLSNAEIIEMAALQLAVDQSPTDTALIDSLKAAFERLEDLGDRICIVFAAKIQGGRPYNIDTDNSETVRRVRSLAADLGARIVDFEKGGGSTSIVFTPPTK
jgi:hypothetical protein